jgi:hypothetical protein
VRRIDPAACIAKQGHDLPDSAHVPKAPITDAMRRSQVRKVVRHENHGSKKRFGFAMLRKIHADAQVATPSACRKQSG